MNVACVLDLSQMDRRCGTGRCGERELLGGLYKRPSGDGQAPLISVGRYALRGVARPQELFTLEGETT